MPRTDYLQRQGTYTRRRDGAFIGTFSTQAYYHYLFRSDIIKRGKDLVTGWRDPTSYSMTYIRERGPFGRYRNGRDEIEGYLYSVASGSNVPIGYDTPDPPTWWLNACIIDALNDLNDGGPSLSVALGERKETAEMLGYTLSSLYRSYRSARRGRFREAFRHLGYNPEKGWDKNLSSKVLAYNLGVKPLISDMYAAVDKLSRDETKHGVGFVKVTGRRASGDMEARRLVIDDQGFMPRKLYYSEYMETVVRLHWAITNEPMASAEDAGLANPALLAWELLPLSFVVDYVVPFGDYLSALTAPLGYTWRGGDSVQWRQCKTAYAGHRSSASKYTEWLVGDREVRKMSRAQMITAPTPSFPTLKSPVDAKKALNVLALFSQFR